MPLDDEDDDENSDDELVRAVHEDDFYRAQDALDRGAHPDAPDWKNGNRPVLLTAIEKGFDGVAELLVQRGADLDVDFDVGSDKKLTYLHVAAIADGVDITRVLLSKIDVNTRCQYDDATALHYAVRERSFQTMKLLLKSGADVNAADSDGQTPLHVAAVFGEVRIIQALLNNGADPNATDNKGQTPLLIAINEDSNAAIGTLVAITDLNATTSARYASFYRGYTALHAAVENSNVAAIKLIVAAGADIDAPEAHRGKSPLHLAARNDDIDVVELLVSLGADRSVKDRDGQRPVDVATGLSKTFLQFRSVCAGEDTTLPAESFSDE